HRVPRTELHGVLRHIQPTPQELHIDDPQADRLTPPDPRVGKHQHEHPVLARFAGQPADVIGREIHVAPCDLARQILDSLARVGRTPSCSRGGGRTPGPPPPAREPRGCPPPGGARGRPPPPPPG